MTIDRVLSLLRRALSRAGTERKLAVELGVSQTTINLVLNGKREPEPKLLAALGLERVVTYRERSGV